MESSEPAVFIAQFPDAMGSERRSSASRLLYANIAHKKKVLSMETRLVSKDEQFADHTTEQTSTLLPCDRRESTEKNHPHLESE